MSYNYSMSCTPGNGHLYFQLFKSSQLVQAYKVSKEIIVRERERESQNVAELYSFPSKGSCLVAPVLSNCLWRLL